ncbi:MAG: hypothetical protein CMJ19_05155 [Phycisphaeraceae bacterium]|nr:hypothetical protein [Phycisphaeraceae bacterium]
MDKLIFKKISGQPLSKEEKQIFFDWLEADKKNRRAYMQLKLSFLQKNKQEVANTKEVVWKEIERSAKKNNLQEKWPYLRWAASIFLILTLGWAIFYNIDYLIPDKEIAAINFVEKVSPQGQKLTVSLPDGSKVKLNSGSRLRSPEVFQSERRVYIEGEAFFEVTKSEMPFIVEAGDVEVSVLGTSFNVNTSSTNEISVAVATGKVLVSAKTSDFQIHRDLVPGEMVLYKEGKPLLELSNYDSEEILGWKDNLLVFKEDTFSDVLKDLNDWYGVTFIVDEQINFDETYNGTFINPTLEVVMESLAHLYSFKFQIHEKQVNISKK